MKNTIKILFLLLSLSGVGSLWGQQVQTLTGKIVSEMNEPIENAVVTVNTKRAVTGQDGTFSIDLSAEDLSFTVWAVGYFQTEQMINNRTEITVNMIPENTYKYNESAVLPFRDKGVSRPGYTSTVNLAKKDFVLGRTNIDGALTGQVAGLQVKKISGMPGEGSYVNLRGIRSVTGDNAPLIVIDGTPYLPDKNESQLLGGYTRDIFQSYNLQDIQNITILKGAEAALYGSMGSNGVIMIETDGSTSNDLETRVSYYGTFGINWNKKRIPMLEGNNYLSYLSDVAMTHYTSMNDMYNGFPFLKDPDNTRYSYIYNNATDWQGQIYRNGITTDHLFRIEGGDAVAKYDFSLGYAREEGILESTHRDRYHARMDASFVVNSQVDITFSAGLSYIDTELQEQGISRTTNPLLTAYAQSPVLSPYDKDADNNVLNTYRNYNFGNNTTTAFRVSNPVAIINTIDASTRQYDTNIRASVNYRPAQDWVLSATYGLYYNYDNEHIFIPGLSQKAILATTNVYGTANNTVRDGVAESFNMYYNVNGRYGKTFNGVHRFNALAGLQVMTTKYEYDAGEGWNTASDFYQTLENTTTAQKFFGYLDKWNWLNAYAHADYTYNNILQAAVNLSLDGASSTGNNATRHYLYPGVSVAWLGKGWKPLQQTSWISQLNVRAEYSVTGNSRFSTNLGKFYYNSVNYDQISGLARVNVPNEKLKPEKNNSLNVGLDLGLWQNRLSLSVDYFDNRISDMILARPLSSVYGSGVYYDNIGKLTNQGVELALQASLVRIRNFEWIVGGNISTYSSKVTSLGDVNQIVYYGLDGAQMVIRTGESPYQFYGYQMLGVFATEASAEAANLETNSGSKYQAGDVHFADQNGDHVINDNDRVLLGSAAPDYFGGFYTHFQYKSFALTAEFVYSVGNKAYNATRRETESMNTMKNQSKAVLNRWILDGQVTDTPRALYGDYIGNSAYSSRWIEDASYLKMRSVTLSYSFDRTLLNFFRSGTFYLTGENLFTVTKYLGMDPEIAYSYGENVQGYDYAKLAMPRTIKAGINLKF